MSSYLYLFSHVLSHALLGAAITYCLLPRNTWKNRIVSLVSGALCGISPDLFGTRLINLWSHSIFFSPFIVILIALLTKKFFNKITFRMIWGTSILSVVFGHLFLDYMGHDLPAFYPFSDKSFIMGAVTLGDPWIWFPLVVGLVVSLCLKHKPKLPVIIAMLFVVMYLMFKVTAKEIIYHKVQNQYPMSEESYTIIEPNTHYEYSLNPIKWLEFRFETISSHHLRGGYAGNLGGKIREVVWHYFYPVARKIEFRYGKYTLQPVSNSKGISLFVKDEWKEEGFNFIKGQMDDSIYTFKEVKKGQWEEVNKSKK